MVGQRSVRVSLSVLGIALGVLAAPIAAAEPAVPADPAPLGTEQPATAQADAAPQEMSHLPSPDNLPPGTTRTPPERRTLGYLRDIWQTIRTEDVSMSDALLLFAQRPMSSAPPGRSPRQGPVAPTGADPVPKPPDAEMIP